MKKSIKIIENDKGMTLLEIVVAFFLVSVASLMLLTSLTTAAKLVKEATDFKNGSADVASLMELDETADAAAAVKLSDLYKNTSSVQINGSNNMWIKGKFIYYEDDKDPKDTNKTNTKIRYKIFVPIASDTN